MVDLETVSFVISSEYRKNVLKHLYSGKDTPSNIAENNDMYPSHVSNTLGELKEENLVTQLVQSSKGRFYGLTDKGEEVAEEIEKENRW
jgi:predicted transcriptional regulator